MTSDWCVNTSVHTNTNPGRLSATLFGVPVSQLWVDLMLWERFFNEYHPSALVELGTGRGGLSLFFALQCEQRDMRFTTIDNQNWLNIIGPLSIRLRDKFYHGDVFNEAPLLIRDAQHHGGSTILFCDNGDKPREFQSFVPLLRPGDFVAVHDYGTEFKAGDVGDLSVTMLDAELCEGLNSMTRWFKING